jgi:8-hydroxy-5-deazaflavin:NADPH oxidoreductase
MSYAIVGFGKIGQALAHAFARNNIKVAVASRRPPEALAPHARAIGPTIVTKLLRDALEADIVLLAVPFWSHREVAKSTANWQGRIVVDVTNAYGVDPKDLGGRPSSVVVSEALTGARVVKAFNHLPATVLAKAPPLRAGAGWCSYRATTRPRSLPSHDWPRRSASHLSTSEASPRAARLSKPKATAGPT